MTITGVEAWACSVPLPHPLSFGSFAITSREYVALRIATRDGEADCVALSRRAPIDCLISEILAPHLIGRDARQVEDIMSDLYIKTWMLDLDGIVARALSQVNICLWDLRAKARQEPLWRTLGGGPRDLRLLVVEGYALPGESDEDFARRLASRVRETGCDLKIEAASYRDPRQLLRRLQLLRESVGDEVRIVVDMAWTWRSLEQAIEAEELWRDFGPYWIEDPFPRDRLELTARLRERIRTPLAAADEVTRPNDLTGLIERGGTDVIRIDAHAIGGISRGAEVAGRARAAGLAVSLHTHPEVHEHCALAWGSDHVELFAEDRPFDCIHELICDTAWQRAAGGRLAPNPKPGSGVRLNVDAVNRTAYRRAATGRNAGV